MTPCESCAEVCISHTRAQNPHLQGWNRAWVLGTLAFIDQTNAGARLNSAFRQETLSPQSNTEALAQNPAFPCTTLWTQNAALSCVVFFFFFLICVFFSLINLCLSWIVIVCLPRQTPQNDKRASKVSCHGAVVEAAEGCG